MQNGFSCTVKGICNFTVKSTSSLDARKDDVKLLNYFPTDSRDSQQYSQNNEEFAIHIFTEPEQRQKLIIYRNEVMSFNSKYIICIQL
jgi:hypothetical protein